MNAHAATAQRSTSAIPQALEHAPMIGCLIATTDGRVLDANRTLLDWLELMSVAELEGGAFPARHFPQPDEWSHWLNASRRREQELRVHARTAAGRELLLRGSFTTDCVHGESRLCGVFVDCTELDSLHEALLRSAGSEAITTLAAGMSHDLNNLLTVLIGNLSLLSEWARRDDALFDKVKRARDAAKRGSDLVRQLMALARGTKAGSEAHVVDMAKVIADLTPLLNSTLGARIRLETRFDPQPVLVNVNRAMLESVVTNLVVNARDALGDMANGTVAIKISGVELDTSKAHLLGIGPGSYATLVVEDTGCGMDDRVAARVFEPFFSTKGRKNGNGLGLPMVRWFSERTGGAVTVRTAPSAGTTVTVLLPRALAIEPPDTSAMTVPLAALPGGSEQVTIWSTDPDFRATVEQILGAVGYRASASQPDRAALSSLGNTSAAILVLDGQAVSEPLAQAIDDHRLRSRHHIGVVLVGDSAATWMTAPAVVSKPFTLSELTRAVRSAAKGV